MTISARLRKKLSQRARERVQCDPLELREKNADTRRFYEQAGRPDPVRWLYRKRHMAELVSPDASLEGGREATRDALEAIGFEPLGTYAARGVKFERWVGPDGAIFLEAAVGHPRYFLVAYFTNHDRIVLGPDDEIFRKKADREPVQLLFTDDDLYSDYARILEAVLVHEDATGARPFYRWRDRELDLEGYRYYLEHMVTFTTMKEITLSEQLNLWFGIVMGDTDLVMENFSSDSARTLFDEAVLGVTTSKGVEYPCAQCGRVNRVPYANVGLIGSCGSCSSPLKTTSMVIRLTESDHFGYLRPDAKVPLVVAFIDSTALGAANWLDGCERAAAASDGKFAVVCGDFFQTAGVAVPHGLTTTGLLYFVDGKLKHARPGDFRRSIIERLGRGELQI